MPIATRVTKHPQSAPAKHKKGMSKARRAHLRRVMKAKWAAKRAVQAATPTPAVRTDSMESSDFRMGFIKGIMFTMTALED
jgi:hypothetical protein